MNQEQLLTDYKYYYKVRMIRYQNDPLFKYSYEAERAMYHIFEQVKSMEELMSFKEKGVELSNKVAIALIKDVAQIELNWYKENKEVVKILAPQQTLAEIDNCKTIADTIQLATNIELHVQNKDVADGLSADTIYKAIDKLVEIEEYSGLKFSRSEYQDENDKLMQSLKDDIVQMFQELKEQAIGYDPEWSFDVFLIKEARHTRRIIFDEELINEKCKELNEIWKQEIQ